MKTTGVFRKIDEVGRIVIPREIRKTLGIESGDPIEIFTHNKEIVLRKYDATGGLAELVGRLSSEFDSVRHDLDEETADQMYGHIKALQDLAKRIGRSETI